MILPINLAPEMFVSRDIFMRQDAVERLYDHGFTWHQLLAVCKKTDCWTTVEKLLPRLVKDHVSGKRNHGSNFYGEVQREFNRGNFTNECLYYKLLSKHCSNKGVLCALMELTYDDLGYLLCSVSRDERKMLANYLNSNGIEYTSQIEMVIGFLRDDGEAMNVDSLMKVRSMCDIAKVDFVNIREEYSI